jgi:hypothetical protein
MGDSGTLNAGSVQRSAYDHLKGGCESQKLLLHRVVRINPNAQLMCDRQRGSTAKAVISLVRFCPTFSVAPVLAIACMVAAQTLQKGEHDPAGEIV